jgi:hypothetical protein
LGALSTVSGKYSKFVSIVSHARVRSSLHNGSNVTMRDLPKFSDFEYNLLLLLSRSVVISAADEIYACIALINENVPAQNNDVICRRFFNGFASCIRGYKQVADSLYHMRKHVLSRALRRLQGGLLISKVYVNCLVSVSQFYLLNRILKSSFVFDFVICFCIRCASIYQKRFIKQPFIVHHSIQRTNRMSLHRHLLRHHLPQSARIRNSGGFLMQK